MKREESLNTALRKAEPDEKGNGPRKQLLLRIDPGLHKELRILAAQTETTIQAIGVRALQQALQAGQPMPS